MDSVYGLLFHRAEDFYISGIEKIYRQLTKLKEAGKIKKIAHLFMVIHSWNISYLIPVDIVQLPFIIFDQRLLDLEAFKLLNKANVEIHSRSTFLQS